MEKAICKPAKKLRSHAASRVDLPVPYRKPGNVVEHICVGFKISSNGEYYKVLVLCNEADKRLTNLPDFFYFQLKNGGILSPRKDLCIIAQEIVTKLQLRNKVYVL